MWIKALDGRELWVPMLVSDEVMKSPDLPEPQQTWNRRESGRRKSDKQSEARMTTVDQTLQERGSRYGDFSDHAVIAQSIQDVMRKTPGWERLDAVKKQALTVIADKQARILSGDPEYGDNWHDIQGYARLVEERLHAD